MLYTLMHKEIPVADININETFHIVDKVLKIYNIAHIPLGTIRPNGHLDIKEFSDWFFNRGIPESRNGITEALHELYIGNVKDLLLKSRGLSLSDQYWYCRTGEDTQWSKINFFDTEFSDDIGCALFGINKNKTEANYDSPDTTSNGNLRKRWTIQDGKRILIKAGKGPLYQEPFNEVIASIMMARLKIPHIEYSLEFIKGEPYCTCENFINAKTELVSAAYIIKVLNRDNADSLYEHLIKCYTKFGLSEVRLDLERMLTIDYLIGNRDRHLNNFGIIRDAETLQWLKTAPIFDSGASLWNESGIKAIKPDHEIESMPFKRNHSEQIRLVRSFDWLDFNALNGIEHEIDTVLKKSAYIDSERRNAIGKCVMLRSKELQKIAEEVQSGSSPSVVQVCYGD